MIATDHQACYFFRAAYHHKTFLLSWARLITQVMFSSGERDEYEEIKRKGPCCKVGVAREEL